MHHNKNEHIEKVANCWKYSSGNCEYGEYNCWFTHTKNEIVMEPAEIECNRCEQVFTARSEFLKNRKQVHKQFVPNCRNAQNRNNITK